MSAQELAFDQFELLDGTQGTLWYAMKELNSFFDNHTSVGEEVRTLEAIQKLLEKNA